MEVIIGAVVGLAGVLFGIGCYLEARKWAKECRETHIAIAFKGKVKLSPSLEEVILWGRAAKKGGTQFYGAGGTRAAVFRSSPKLSVAHGENRKNASVQGK